MSSSCLSQPRHPHDKNIKSDRIKNWPKDERPRERLLKEGAHALTEAELLAIILRVGHGTFKQGARGQNASDFARTLLKAFVRRNTSMAVKIEGKPERTEQWEYPLDAVREAITNAVCHRDYANTGNVQVRALLLHDLETGKLPWTQKEWPLPGSGLDAPVPDREERFPMIDDLIEIAINEKKPDQVLRWYEQLPKDHFGWYGIDEDKVATSIQIHAPERAVAIWEKRAERLIALVKPQAYQEAARFLRKAAKVMALKKKQAEWEHYLKELREKHIRKQRLIEILDGLDGKPIVKMRH